ncbi:hypothetical protein ACLOJK_030392 [Asimina triloba]
MNDGRSRAAILAAASGAKVAKQGSRSSSSACGSADVVDGSLARLILKTEGNDSCLLPPFGCGFICNGNCSASFFGILILGGAKSSVVNQQVWLANEPIPNFAIFVIPTQSHRVWCFCIITGNQLKAVWLVKQIRKYEISWANLHQRLSGTSRVTPDIPKSAIFQVKREALSLELSFIGEVVSWPTPALCRQAEEINAVGLDMCRDTRRRPETASREQQIKLYTFPSPARCKSKCTHFQVQLGGNQQTKLAQRDETLQQQQLPLRHLQRKQAVCRNAGLKTRRRFPRNSSVEGFGGAVLRIIFSKKSLQSFNQVNGLNFYGCNCIVSFKYSFPVAVFFGGSQWAAGLFEIAGKPSTFYFLVLLSEPFYYLYNTHLFELHLFVVKAEREECIVVAELRDTFP